MVFLSFFSTSSFLRENNFLKNSMKLSDSLWKVTPMPFLWVLSS